MIENKKFFFEEEILKKTVEILHKKLFSELCNQTENFRNVYAGGTVVTLFGEEFPTARMAVVMRGRQAE